PISATLAENNMAVAVKTHDATDWMSTYDTSLSAITGPTRVGEIAAQFEDAGVPFHAWCVVKGIDPFLEAQMASEVLAAGARSLIIDLEAGYGFYEGNAETAVQYGAQLRALQPDATITVSIDPRPWRATLVPLTEFAAFSDGWLPQVYWETFNSPANVTEYDYAGYGASSTGITPELILQATMDVLSPYTLPILPVGQGDSPNMDAWQRFIDHSTSNGMNVLSTWRYGVTNPAVWPLLKTVAAGHETYVIQDGDALSVLAEQWGVSVEQIAELNGIVDPNFVQAGQTVCRPT
ncbi:MAG TPA: LysM domain-containing protein, partial [Dehalococcoidia bacterium]|nr:LysM domain-containing protein [Dehalococcoidia bacterium]